MADYTSPNVLNLQVAKGTVSWTPEGGSPRDLGNAPSVSVEPTVETLPHFSSRAGIKKKDFEPVTSLGLTLSLTLDEITVENLRMHLLGGEVTTNTAGNKTFLVGAVSEVRGSITITGTNDLGPKYKHTYPKVSFRPSAALDLISDEYNEIEFEAEITFDDSIGAFGEVELLETEEPTA